MLLRFLFIFVFYATQSLAQTQQIKGKIVDKLTGKGLAYVHVQSLSHSKIGSISNEQGDFILKLPRTESQILVSHVGYQSQVLPVTPGIPMHISLSPEDEVLNEVVVTAQSAREVVQQAIARLKENHAIEPVHYQFFSRIITFTPKDSTVDLLEEHIGYIYQKENHNSAFALQKSRLGYFSKVGKKEYNDYRLIGMTEMYTDNIFKYTGHYLHPRKSKKYTYAYSDDVTLGQHDCYVIHFNNPDAKYHQKGTLYIDKLTFAIAKEVKDYGTSVKEITHKQIGDKWYLSNTLYNRSNEKIVRLYNVVSPPAESDVQYVDKGLLAPNFAKKYTQDFSDEYWEEVNFVPLPNWVATRIQQQKGSL